MTLTIIHGQTDLNHEHKECSIISETVEAIPIKFATKIIRQKVYVIFSQSDDLARQGHNCVSNLKNVKLVL